VRTPTKVGALTGTPVADTAKKGTLGGETTQTIEAESDQQADEIIVTAMRINRTTSDFASMGYGKPNLTAAGGKDLFGQSALAARQKLNRGPGSGKGALRSGEIDRNLAWDEIPETPSQSLMYQTAAGGGKDDDKWAIRWVLGQESAKGGWIVQRVIVGNAVDDSITDWIYEAWKVPAGSRFTTNGPEPGLSYRQNDDMNGNSNWRDDTFDQIIDRGGTVYAQAWFFEGMKLPSYFVSGEKYGYPSTLPTVSKTDAQKRETGTAKIEENSRVRVFLQTQKSTPPVSRNFKF
jgi:hypothetical protein